MHSGMKIFKVVSTSKTESHFISLVKKVVDKSEGCNQGAESETDH